MSKTTIDRHWELWERMKFRAWWHHDEKPGTMYEVWEIDFQTSHINVSKEGSLRPHFSDVAIMQYTALKDKNGVEIYEEDILEITNMDQSSSNYMMSEGRHRVFYGAGGFMVEWETNMGTKTGIDLRVYAPQRAEVVGNIYENPELLNNENIQ